MIKNYLKIAARTIWRHKAYSSINIVGLTMGIAASVLILLFVQNERSFDKHHENAENVYRIGLDAAVAGQTIKTTNTSAPMARTLIAEFPEVVNATRINDISRVLISVEERRFYEERFFFADSTVFEIFTIPFVEGDPATALTQPNTVVLTEEMARKYFGEADPIGQTIRYDNRVDYEVTGIIRPVEANTHLRVDFLASFVTLPRADEEIWLNNSFYTYVLLQDGADPEALLAKTPDLIAKYVAPQVEQAIGQTYEKATEAGLRWGYFLEKLPDIYLHSDADGQIGPIGDIQYVYILLAIAAFILLIACINFMNLSTARSANRAKEVGVRKVMGSERSQLVRQFLGESVFTAMVALVLAVGVVILVLPAFQNLTGVVLSLNVGVVAGMVGIAVAAGLVAGVYPAFVLSAFSPAKVLKGTFRRGASRSWMRSGLVVSQFAISIMLLVGTFIVFEQLQFIRDKDLGFEKDHVVVLPIETREAAESFESFRATLLQNPNIVNAAAAGVVPGPGHIHNTTAFRKEGARDEEIFIAAAAEVTWEYVETLGLEMIAGRDFDRAFTTDVEGFIVNEAAVREMGWDLEEAVGKTVTRVQGNDDDSDRVGSIIGVFKDAHFNSLHETVRPMILGGRPRNIRYLPVRIQAGQVRETMAYLEEQWTAFEPAHLFNYFFLDEDYGLFYEQEERLGDIYGYFTLLAIFIACLGLFGLASFVTQQRTKEIGVRKVLGASVPGIVVLLTKEFTYLVIVAAVLAFPAAYYFMTQWLQNFAYATSIGFDVFVVSGVAALLIAWLTVGYQAVKAAVANPVTALRYE